MMVRREEAGPFPEIFFCAGCHRFKNMGEAVHVELMDWMPSKEFLRAGPGGRPDLALQWTLSGKPYVICTGCAPVGVGG